MRKPAKNKVSDQLHVNRAADQHLCIRYLDSTVPLLPKFQASAVQPGLCWTWSETPKTGFLVTRLICIICSLTVHVQT